MNKQLKELTLDYVNHGYPFTIYYEIDRFINSTLIGREYDYLLEHTGLLNRSNLKIVDLGCNIGTFTLSLYDKANKIYAIDLSAGCIDLLNETINKNRFDRIQAFQRVIAGENKQVRVTSLECTDGGNHIDGKGPEVEAVTLATFFRENGIEFIDLLKVDIEGAEREIFNAADFGEIKDRIKVIIGETHSGVDISETLIGYGFSFDKKGVHFVAMKI